MLAVSYMLEREDLQWRVGYLSFFQGSPQSPCSWERCGLNVQWQSAYEASVSARLVVSHRQWAAGSNTSEALQEAKNRSCKIIHQYSLWRVRQAELHNCYTPSFIPLHAGRAGRWLSSIYGEQNANVQWECGQGQMFKYKKLQHKKTCIKDLTIQHNDVLHNVFTWKF